MHMRRETFRRLRAMAAVPYLHSRLTLFKTLLCAIAFSALAIFAQPAFAQQATVEGTARDALGRPLAGAAIALQDSGGKAVATTVSDRVGHYVFRDVPAGTYAVVASKQDYETAS